MPLKASTEKVSSLKPQDAARKSPPVSRDLMSSFLHAIQLEVNRAFQHLTCARSAAWGYTCAGQIVHPTEEMMVDLYTWELQDALSP